MFTGSSVHCIYVWGIILLCSSITGALDMNNICLLLKNNALIASGDSCSKYYSCYNGTAIPQDCPSSTYFDKNGQMCVKQAPAYCSSSSSNPCSGHPEGSFVAKPDSCDGYYYCSSKGAEAGNCPSGLIFDPTEQSCNYPSDSPCQSNNVGPVNLCSYIQVGVYFGNAFNCSGWLKCISDNKLDNGNCQNSLFYNTARAICDYPSNVKCSQLSYDPQLDVTSNGGGGVCSTAGAMKKAIACNQYYLCDGTQFQLTQCPNNLYYDTNTENCVNRTDAYNDCDRCLGASGPFVNAFGSDCHNYSYCSNGVTKDIQPCPNNGFFNEEMGGCVSANPDFPCCATQDDSTSAPETA